VAALQGYYSNDAFGLSVGQLSCYDIRKVAPLDCTTTCLAFDSLLLYGLPRPLLLAPAVP
jgi:hypothetical protein